MSVTDLIKLHEGLRIKVYTCPAGKLTVGYGRNLEERGLTESEAAILLENDIQDMTEKLSSRYFWFWKLGAVRRAVVIDMSYNLGLAGFHGFQNMIRAIEMSDYGKAATEMLDSRWSKQVGQRSHRLAQMMRSNQWPDEVVDATESN